VVCNGLRLPGSGFGILPKGDKKGGRGKAAEKVVEAFQVHYLIVEGYQKSRFAPSWSGFLLFSRAACTR
jgi:hypothetical protein